MSRSRYTRTIIRQKIYNTAVAYLTIIFLALLAGVGTMLYSFYEGRTQKTISTSESGSTRREDRVNELAKGQVVQYLGTMEKTAKEPEMKSIIREWMDSVTAGTSTIASPDATPPAAPPTNEPPSQLTGLESDAVFDSMQSVLWNHPPAGVHLVGGEFIEVTSSNTHIAAIEVSGVLHTKSRTTWMLKVDSRDASALEQIIRAHRKDTVIAITSQN